MEDNHREMLPGKFKWSITAAEDYSEEEWCITVTEGNKPAVVELLATSSQP